MKAKIVAFLTNLENTYREDKEDATLELTEEGLTEDFTALIMALHIMYMSITGKEVDQLEFTHLINRLIVQHAIKSGSEHDD